jgi:hypothetical protein
VWAERTIVGASRNQKVKTIFHFPRKPAYEETLYTQEKVHSGDPCIATSETAV